MSFDRAVKKVSKRLSAYERTMAAQDTAKAMREIADPAALAEAAKLWREAQPADAARPSHLEALRLAEARRCLGKLHLYRATAMPSGQLSRELAQGLGYLAPIADRPGAVPPAFKQLLGPDADPDQQGGLAAEMLGADADAEDGVFADAVVALLTESVAATPRSSAGYVTRLSNLGAAHLSRYHRTGDAAELDAANELLDRTVAAAGRSDRNLPLYRFNLGSSWLDKYLLSRSPVDALAAAGLLDQALDGLPRTSGLRRDVMSMAMTAHRACVATVAGSAENLERALKLCRQLLETAEEGTGDHAKFRTELGVLLLQRFLDGGPDLDLDQAVESLREAVVATPEDHPERAERLSRLGTAHRRRYEVRQTAQDLELAVAWGEQSVAAPCARPADRAGHYSNVGLAYRERYQWFGEPGDLDRAVAYGEEAVRIHPADDPDRAIALHNLGTAYQRRFERGNARADIDLAVDVAEQAVAATSPGHPMLAERLAGLSRAYEARHTLSGDPADLLRAQRAGNGQRP
ncbi:tetratricopeptide repeat protein [Amycolatopsis saalfeldensis]|uniref:Tetratricopeptide repeat-containing protein n=1 Tax=Amycolatopsis saalfeldensis TaxID=394193 RepID=A0A1H8VYH4_9PSEU|nr:tetratricopeptide repeat protein [Amycolatopsis saalfeldensis]SEP20323.1 Tetratricopeptide repeat-containing protein [Amycolatopsis saalfeldensis]